MKKQTDLPVGHVVVGHPRPHAVPTHLLLVHAGGRDREATINTVTHKYNENKDERKP